MAKELGIPYWIDIQDPLKGTMGQGEPLLSEEQRRSLSDAAQIVTTTATYTRHLQEALPEHADKIKCLRITHNASSSFASDRALQDGRLSLLHAGHLYGRPNRSAAPLLEGIARLYETVPWARGKVTLRLVGKGRGMSEALAWASELGLRQDLECLPPIHPEALQTLLDTADVLCVLKAVEMHRDYQLPGKTYDYLFSSKPILAVTFPGELATIIAETGSGFAVDPTDTERLASILEQLLTQKRAVGSVILERDAGKLSPYSFDAFRETLATILRACAIARTGLPSGTETAKTPEERLFTR